MTLLLLIIIIFETLTHPQGWQNPSQRQEIVHKIRIYFSPSKLKLPFSTSSATENTAELEQPGFSIVNQPTSTKKKPNPARIWRPDHQLTQGGIAGIAALHQKHLCSFTPTEELLHSFKGRGRVKGRTYVGKSSPNFSDKQRK